MADYSAARFHMVEGQLRPNNITDEALVDAFSTLPRELFVPKAARGIAYVDCEIPVGPGRYLLEPLILARLLNEARIQPTDIVLDVGCGTGYSSAVIGRLAATVVALESDGELASRAAQAIREVGLDNVAVVEGPLTQGYAKQAPYDVIVIQGAVAEIPQPLFDQMAEGARLLAVVAPEGRMGRIRIFRKLAGIVSGRVISDGSAPMLPGFEPKPAFEF